MRCALLLLFATVLPALQIEEAVLASPITGGKFPVTILAPNRQEAQVNQSDLGTDDDGCRHSAGLSEYDLYIVSDPTSYFTALAEEWDPATGRFLSDMPDDIKAWVAKELESEWKVDVARAYANAQQLAKAQGQVAPDRDRFLIPQGAIPLEKRYRLALRCYEKRGARPGILAKIALAGAWAIRARVNVPLQSSALDGGYEEVRERIERLVPVGSETFDLQVWMPAYRSVFEDGGLTREGMAVAGLTLFGFQLRDGDFDGAAATLDTLTTRFENDTERKYELLRGLVRERRRMLDEHSQLLDRSVAFLTLAIANEEFHRAKLPPHLLAVAEALRRTGSVKDANRTNVARLRAMDWYYALGRIPESQPALRESIRAQGKVPGPEASFAVQLGWLADTQYARLAADPERKHPGEVSGPDKRLLTAIIFDGLGNSSYSDPGWQPRRDGDQADSERNLKLVGQGVMDYTFRKGAFPTVLGDLWEAGILPDRNRVNRFHDPATGAILGYRAVPGDLQGVSPRLVLVATTAPVPTGAGPRHGAYLAGNQVVWGEQPYAPGSIAR